MKALRIIGLAFAALLVAVFVIKPVAPDAAHGHAPAAAESDAEAVPA